MQDAGCAFAASSLLHLRAYTAKISASPSRKPARWQCVVPKFRRDDPELAPKTSFFEEELTSKRPLTPNERVMAQIQETMERLGVSERAPEPPPKRKPIDISRVNPFSALLGAGAAFFISYVTWNLLQSLIYMYLSHPPQFDLYIIQRISVVIRTALITMLALGSGISGVTGLGLALLAGRTTIAIVTGEFREQRASQPADNDSSTSRSQKDI